MNIRKSRILKVKNSLSELEKDFKKLRQKEIKNRSEIAKLFFKPILCL